MTWVSSEQTTSMMRSTCRLVTMEFTMVCRPRSLVVEDEDGLGQLRQTENPAPVHFHDAVVTTRN